MISHNLFILLIILYSCIDATANVMKKVPKLRKKSNVALNKANHSISSTSLDKITQSKSDRLDTVMTLEEFVATHMTVLFIYIIYRLWLLLRKLKRQLELFWSLLRSKKFLLRLQKDGILTI